MILLERGEGWMAFSPELSSSLSGHVLPNPQKTTSFSVLFHLIAIFLLQWHHSQWP